jgi:hypothetical protein
MLIWAALQRLAFARNIGRRLDVLTGNAERLGRRPPIAECRRSRATTKSPRWTPCCIRTGARLRVGRAVDQAVLKTKPRSARQAELAGVNEELRQETQDNEMFIYSVSHDSALAAREPARASRKSYRYPAMS